MRMERMTDLGERLFRYSESEVYPFHMPGHKRCKLAFPNPYAVDITEVDGFDDLHHADGVLKEAQQRAADLYGARRSFYLVNGSTCGLLAAISAAAQKRDRVLVARNCHKAVYHALCLRELSAVYLYPQITGRDLQGQITAEQVRDALRENPDIETVIVTSPTYEGLVSDIAGIADAAHARGAALIVDAAHGAHFGFGAGFPESPVTQGADAVIMSLHKTLPSFTQTALLHLCSERISESEIERYLEIFETSSPSYLFMAGMDKCIRLLREQGAELFSQYRKRLDSFYASVSDLKYLHVLCRGDLQRREAADLDDSKLVIFTGTSGMDGEALHRRLLDGYGLQMEMVSGFYVLGMTSMMDTEEGFCRLSSALHEIDGEVMERRKSAAVSRDVSGEGADGGKSPGFTRRMYGTNPREMELYQAAELPWAEVSFEDAIGKMSADYICLYPPGIPMIVPGEVITPGLIGRLRECAGRGLYVRAAADFRAERIKIVYF